MVFKLLKRIFAKKPEEIELKIDEITSWFSEKAGNADKEMESALIELKKEFEEEIAQTKSNMKELRDAKLRNPNIPKREFDFMEGNRIAYMRKVVDLLKNIRFPDNVDEIQGSDKEFQQKLDYFTKQSYRPYTIVTQFFDNEANRIAANIKRFDTIHKKLLERYKSIGICRFSSLSNKIKDYSRSGEISEQMKSELEEKKKQMGTIKGQVKESEEDVASLQKSREYKDYSKLKAEKESIESDLKNQSHIFLSPFSTIQRPLKKYSKISMKHTEWIDAYLNDPVDTLMSDENLVLCDILSNMKDNSGSLSLNEKKLARLKKVLKKLDKNSLISFRKKFGMLEEKKANTERSLDSTTVIGRISKANEELESIRSKEKIIAQQIEELESDISKIDRDKMMDELVTSINRLLDVEIKLVD